MMDSGCDVHFTQNRCWISKDDGKGLDMIRQRRSILRCSQTFKIVVEGSEHTGTQSDDSSRGRANGTGKGTRCVRNPGVPLQDRRWTVTENPRCASGFPRDRQRPQLKRERCTRLRDTCLIEAGVKGALRRERRTSRI